MRVPTELEYCVLAVIWRDGPISAYRVRRTFLVSATPSWSSSAGSIYPAIRRLASAGLVESASPSDKRGTRLLAASGPGAAALTDWLTTLPAELGAATADPIRTRAQFLGRRGPAERERFVRTAERVTGAAVASLEAQAKALESSARGEDDLIGVVAAIGELEARLAWLGWLGGRLDPSRRRT